MWYKDHQTMVVISQEHQWLLHCSCGDLDVVGVLVPTTLSAPSSSSANSNEDMGSEEHQEQGNKVAMTDDFKLLLESS
jgi:hypothetical protein